MAFRSVGRTLTPPRMTGRGKNLDHRDALGGDGGRRDNVNVEGSAPAFGEADRRLGVGSAGRVEDKALEAGTHEHLRHVVDVLDPGVFGRESSARSTGRQYPDCAPCSRPSSRSRRRHAATRRCASPRRPRRDYCPASTSTTSRLLRLAHAVPELAPAKNLLRPATNKRCVTFDYRDGSQQEVQHEVDSSACIDGDWAHR